MKIILALKMTHLVYKLGFHDHLDNFYLLAGLLVLAFPLASRGEKVSPTTIQFPVIKNFMAFSTFLVV